MSKTTQNLSFEGELSTSVVQLRFGMFFVVKNLIDLGGHY
jgi:hypothetical protein